MTKKVVVHMVCTNCGQRDEENNNFCTACGNQLKKRSVLVMQRWMILLLTALFVMIFSESYTLYEEQVLNEYINHLVDQGEFLALQGKYHEANQEFQKAIKLIPNDPLLIENIILTTKAISIENDIKQISNLLNKGYVNDADTLISATEKHIIELESVQISNQLMHTFTKIKQEQTVRQIKKDMKAANSLVDYAILFTKVSNSKNLNTDEIKRELLHSFNDYIMNEANKAIRQGNYEKAASIVNHALQYDYENEKLKTFQATQFGK
jgi:Flp pilus assembly protein TadD/ribosomal protein L37E